MNRTRAVSQHEESPINPTQEASIKSLSIVIPAFNERTTIRELIARVRTAPLPGTLTKEIIIVDDGSTDDTLNLIKKFNHKENKIKIISLPINQGKGEALKKGIQAATGEFVIIQDGDLEYDPSDYSFILSEFKNKNTSIVYGSRILGAKIYHNYNASIFFLIGGLLLTKTVNIIFGTKLTDQPTGFKSWRNVLSKNLLKYCQSNGFEFEVEMTAFFSKTNKIKEVPIHYYPRTVGHGKKITLVDFIKSILMVLRCKFIKRDNIINRL